MIPGMRDFFGKKLGRHVRHFMAHFSPIDLADDLARKKLVTSYRTGGLKGAFDAFQKMGGQRSYRWKDYFMGLNIEDVAAGRVLSDSLAQRRQWTRIGVPALVGAAAVMPGTIGNALGFVRDAGIHTAIAATAGSYMSPMLGAAYAGWAGVNVLRRGDNFGPF